MKKQELTIVAVLLTFALVGASFVVGRSTAPDETGPLRAQLATVETAKTQAALDLKERLAACRALDDAFVDLATITGDFGRSYRRSLDGLTLAETDTINSLAERIKVVGEARREASDKCLAP